ncbi:MAG TPA: TolC family protein [Thermodesulfobacteriota bacterium]
MNGTIFLILLSLTGAQDTIDLSLQEAIKIALEHNRDIQIVKKTVEISVGDIETQKGIFDPAITLSSSYTKGEFPTVSSFIPSGIINQGEFLTQTGLIGNLPTGTFYNLFNFSVARTTSDSNIVDLTPSWTTNLGFTIGQNLLQNFGLDVNLTPITVAKISSEISVKELETTISDVLLNVETAYWNLVAAKKNLGLAYTTLDLSKDLQRRNEIQVEVGVLPPVSVTEAKSEVARNEVGVIIADNALKAAEDTLKNILAIPITQKIDTTDEPTTVFKTYDETQVLDEALENRPEVAQAKLDIESKGTLKKFYSNQRLPNLSVQASVQLQGLGGSANPDRISAGGTPDPIPPQFDQASDAFRQLAEGDFPTLAVLGILSFPIFNWTAKGDYVKASANLDRSVITFKKVEDDVELDVSNAIRAIENSIKGINATNVSVELAEEVLRNEQERLNVGIGTTRNVLDAQRDLVDAKFAQIRAMVDYNIALAQLERAKGTILETKGVKVQD